MQLRSYADWRRTVRIVTMSMARRTGTELSGGGKKGKLKSEEKSKAGRGRRGKEGKREERQARERATPAPVYGIGGEDGKRGE